MPPAPHSVSHRIGAASESLHVCANPTSTIRVLVGRWLQNFENTNLSLCVRKRATVLGAAYCP